MFISLTLSGEMYHNAIPFKLDIQMQLEIEN